LTERFQNYQRAILEVNNYELAAIVGLTGPYKACKGLRKMN